MMFEIRPARIEGYEDFTRIVRKSLGFMNSRKFFERKIKNGRVFVCVVDDKVVGVFEIVDEGVWLNIVIIAVDRGYRGKGVGRRIVDFVLDLARKGGKVGVYANPIESAVGFFEKLGFRVHEGWKGNEFERRVEKIIR